MVTKGFLEAQLRLLIEHFGCEQVELALRRIAGADRPAHSGRDAPGKKKSRPRLTATEYVSRMAVPDDHRRVLDDAAVKFQEKSFLPTVGDVRNFCEDHGIAGPFPGSRADTVPKVFRLLARMDTDDLRRMLDSDMFSGPARLGPIADAIHDAGRERILDRTSREDGLSGRGASE